MRKAIESYGEATLTIVDGEEVRVSVAGRTIGVVVERDEWTAVPFNEQPTFNTDDRNRAIDYVLMAHQISY
jgi:predicted metal-dependent phosphoesterase TrpH